MNFIGTLVATILFGGWPVIMICLFLFRKRLGEKFRWLLLGSTLMPLLGIYLFSGCHYSRKKAREAENKIFSEMSSKTYKPGVRVRLRHVADEYLTFYIGKEVRICGVLTDEVSGFPTIRGLNPNSSTRLEIVSNPETVGSALRGPVEILGSRDEVYTKSFNAKVIQRAELDEYGCKKEGLSFGSE